MKSATLIWTTIFAFFISSSCVSAPLNEPGGTLQDTELALTNPDQFAWQLFLFLNHQALPGTAGVADPTKKSITEYDPDKDVVWETWALASGLDLKSNPDDNSISIVRNISEVFKKPATKPVDWEKLTRGPSKSPLSPNFKNILPLLEILRTNQQSNFFHILIAPLGSNPSEDEVRMNRSTYDTIRSQRLYSVEGLEQAATNAKQAGNRLAVKFEQMSKEVKARWRLLPDCQADSPCPNKERYHWRVINNPETKQKEVWGLVALHIITKDLPNWFWADFGHIDCETGVGACKGVKPAETPLKDSTTTNSGGKRQETLKSKWEYYRLRGAQIDFVNSIGVPTILSNPIIEEDFQTSSCITCHSRATVGLKGTVPESGTSLPFFARQDFVRNMRSDPAPTVPGAPPCQKFYGKTSGTCPDEFSKEQLLYFQTDFLWSMPFRAFSEKE
jgi:hypothetical protein